MTVEWNPVVVSDRATRRRADGKAPKLNDAGSSVPRFRLVRFRDIELAKGAPYLVKGILPREGLVVAWGPPKCGKSFWIFDLVMHVALGQDYRGRAIEQGPVVYVACEGERGLGARVEAYRRHHGITANVDPPFHLITTRLDLVVDHSPLIVDIRAQLGEEIPSAIVVDTLNRTLAGSESSDEDMAAYVKAADAIREVFRCAVVIIHHCGHDATRPRGHTSLVGAVDAQLAIRRDKGTGTITVLVEWLKDGAEGDQIISRLDVIEVGMDDDGEPITSCVIVEADPSSAVGAEARKKGRAPSPAAVKFHDGLVNACAANGKRGPESAHRPAVSMALWKAECVRLGLLDPEGKADAARSLFSKYRRELVTAEWVGCNADLAWSLRAGK
jgi:AAA domain